MANENKPSETSDSGANTVKAVETSVTIIESLKQENLAGITELASATDISKSNIHKHLTTLRNQGFVTKEDGKYRLSLRYLDFGGDVRSRYAGTRLIKPKIAELAERTQEVAQFMVEDRGYSVVVYKEFGREGVSLRTRLGTHLPMHQVASGKAMLANMPHERVVEIIDSQGLEQATDNTITERASLFDELEKTRERGYAVNNKESTKGLHAMAAPITSPDGLIGACAVSGPSHRMQEKTQKGDIPEVLLSISNEIELNIAHS